MAPPIQLTVPVVLLGAAQLLRIREWSRGLMVCPDRKRMCMVGAIETFIGETAPTLDAVVADNLKADAVNQVTRTIWRLHPELNQPHVTAFNDRICKSAEEAAQMLESAVEIPSE